MRRGSLFWTATVLCALGCASEQGVAQENPPPAQPPAPPAEPDKKGKQREVDEEKLEEGRRYQVSIQERGREGTFKLGEAALFVPEVSLFGGEGGALSKLLRLKCGAAELLVPFRRIKRVEIGVEKEDRLEVKVQLLPEGTEVPAPLAGTIKAGLELRGTYEGTGLKATVKLREVTQVELEPLK